MTDTIIIPLLTQFNADKALHWANLLQSALAAESSSNQFIVLPHDQLSASERKKCKVAICANPSVEQLAAYPRLVWMQSLWAGVDSILPLFKNSPIELVRLIDPQLAQSMSESVLLWSLYLHKQIPVYAKQQSLGVWEQHLPVLPRECCVGILGAGELGRVSAERLRQNGFTVKLWSRSKKNFAGIGTFSGNDGLKRMLPQCNILVVLLPLTPSTSDLLCEEKLLLLPKGASVINFARGEILPEKGVLSLLSKEHISHAVLDVFCTEPLPQDSKLWRHPNVTVLPHVSAQTHPQTSSVIVAKNIVKYYYQDLIPVAVDKHLGY